MGHKGNLAAFSPAGAVVGHCFLVADGAGSAELAIFVHQEFRRRGVGTALVRAALEWGAVAGLRRVWTLTSSDNKAALRMQEKCGFRLTNAAFPETELEIDLPVRSQSKVVRQSAIKLIPPNEGCEGCFSLTTKTGT